MTAADVLAEARHLGIELTVTSNERVRVAFDGDLPDDLRLAILANRQGLIALLPGSTRQLYALDGDTGRVVAIESLDAAPAGTTYVCRLGDTAWTPVPTPAGQRVDDAA